MNYYTKLKDEEKIVILIDKGFTKEQFQEGGSLRNDIGRIGQEDMEKGEVHCAGERFTIKVKLQYFRKFEKQLEKNLLDGG